MTAVRGYQDSMAGKSGIILCCRQFMNSLEDSSLEEIKAAIRSEPWLEAFYEIGEKYVRSKDGRIRYSFIGLDRNINSIKSKAKILLCWVDEAEPVLESSWIKLIPTIREEGSELWVTWNPESERSDVHKRFRLDPLEDEKIVEMNWRDNPWFPAVLERERQADLAKRPEAYDHIWEGGFITALAGAYYAKHLNLAKAEGRICKVDFDPLMTVRLFVDIGGTGAKADAFSIWPAQFIGDKVLTRDYYEAVGQPLSAHLAWLQGKGYVPGKAQFWLPHDGHTHDRVFAVSYESELRRAGYQVTVIPNQGPGAAAARVEAGRKLFHQIHFDAETTEAGRSALGWYHEKRDDKRGIGLGPEHDWASHGADAFGLMCVAHNPPQMQRVRLGGI